MDLVTNAASRAPTAAQLERFHARLAKVAQVDAQTKHFLVPGPDGLNLYARQVTVPANHQAVGSPHKRSHLVSCCGDIELTTDTDVRRLTGFHTFVVTGGGLKRAVRTYAETVWTTYHVVNASTIDEIEEELVRDAHLLQTRNLAVGMSTPPLIEA